MNQENLTVENLQELLQNVNLEVNDKPIKYVIYARQSTDKQEGTQEFSVEDQVRECEDYANRCGFHYSKEEIVVEKASARYPDIRPLFRKMLKNIEIGKYQGIITWHPDRLARNMKEAGEIIDMLDSHILEELRFPTFSFTNDDGGRMLLGISFVMAKQYSDKLKTDIRRGNKRRTEEGKYLGMYLLGYKKTPTQYLIPDGENFQLVKEAWNMRLHGKTCAIIADFLNKNTLTFIYNKYDKETRQSTPTIKQFVATERNLTRAIFSKSAYAGVIKHGANTVILNETNSIGFVPMITPEEYTRINPDIGKRSKRFSKKNIKATNLLEGKVICNGCGEARTIQTPSKLLKSGGKRTYISYRCDTVGCKFYGKSIRSKELLHYAVKVIKKLTPQNDSLYEMYKHDYEEALRDKINSIEKEIEKTEKQESFLMNNMKKSFESYKNETNAELKGDLKMDYLKIKGQVSDTNGSLAEMKNERKGLDKSLLSVSDFFELWAEIPSLLENASNVMQVEVIMNNLFLNFTVSRKEVLSCRLNPYLENIFKHENSEKLLTGGDGGN